MYKVTKITKEQEQECWNKYTESGNLQDLELLFKSVFFFIEKRVKKNKLFLLNDDFEDVIQDVYLKLITSLKYYKPEKGRFSTFCDYIITNVLWYRFSPWQKGEKFQKLISVATDINLSNKPELCHLGNFDGDDSNYQGFLDLLEAEEDVFEDVYRKEIKEQVENKTFKIDKPIEGWTSYNRNNYTKNILLKKLSNAFKAVHG